MTKKEIVKIIETAADNIRDFKTRQRIERLAEDLQYKTISASEKEMALVATALQSWVSNLRSALLKLENTECDSAKEKRLENVNMAIKEIERIINSIE
ncbi:MAG: hypothetical protein FWB72_00020 [Firmicutes bacterium]|nr:hypothetical protein [Bacillota bacterium]